jgi:hypothetical protein
MFGVPRTTVKSRAAGRLTRQGSHVKQQKLLPAQEQVLVDWIKELGRRFIPIPLVRIAEHASVITGEKVSAAWVRQFRNRHPSLKARWTTQVQSCRAQALNETLVNGFYDILESVIAKYHIPPENIYNMDEKGVQLGVGKKARVLVDRDQKTVHQVEDGNREMVTIIETLCADGTVLRPSVIFKGKQRNLEWGRNNPCKARYERGFIRQKWTVIDVVFQVYPTHPMGGQIWT